jgi:nucleoid-associated protein YgaU
MSVTLHSGLLGVSSQTSRVGFSATQAFSASRSSGSQNATSRPKFGASSFSQWRSAQYIRRGATTRAPGPKLRNSAIAADMPEPKISVAAAPSSEPISASASRTV